MKLFIFLLAVCGVVTKSDRCTFIPAPNDGICTSGCFIEATRLCAVNCPYTNEDGKCKKTGLRP